MVTYNLTLDMSTDQVQKMLTVKLGDTDRRIIFTLSNAGSPYEIPSGTTAQFFARKPDANVIYADCTIIGDTIGYTFGEETATAVGILECELRLYSSTQESLSTPKFNIRVTDNAYADGTITSHSDFSALTTAISTANNAATVASAATAAANNLNAAVTKSGSTATITITKKDGTTESASISDGDKGDTGATGPKGYKGDSVTVAYIEDGYLWVGIKDYTTGLTGVHRIGYVNGDKGEKGDKGDKGDTGATGPQGAAGPQGPKGDDAVTDEHFNPASDNAQSGKAVAEAINPILRHIKYSITNGAVTIISSDENISGSYEIPEKIEDYPVTTIGTSAFSDCPYLVGIAIPKTIKRIKSSAFWGSDNLANVYYMGTEAEWSKTIIENYNEPLMSATIHYNQAPAIKQDIYDYTKAFTADEKTKLNNIETGAEVNKIDKIKVNGTTQQITNKSVDITVPTKTSDLNNDSGFIDNSVDNLANYYDKDEVDAEYNTIQGLLNTKQPKTDNNLNTTNKNIVPAINEINSIAKGANQAVSFASYSDIVTAVNSYASDKFNAGQNIMVRTLEVPDLWVYSVESTSVTYTYTTDQAFITALNTDGYVQVGYYKLAQLETQKVDLTDYYDKTETVDLITAKTGNADPTTSTVADFVGQNYINGNKIFECVAIIPQQGTTSETYEWAQVNAPVDQSYTPNSSNAQSGKAVTEAVKIRNILSFLVFDETHPNWISGINVPATSLAGAFSLPGSVWVPAEEQEVNVDAIKNNVFRGCTNIRKIDIPGTIMTIGSSAFQGCTGLESIIIPDSVIGIGSSAFNGCDNITTIKLSNSITSIPEYMLSSTGITSITIPKGVTLIGTGAFSYCLSLNTITIPKTVTTIGNNAFEWCRQLKDVYYGGTEAEWQAISIGTGNEELTQYATIHYNQQVAVLGDVQKVKPRTVVSTTLNTASNVLTFEQDINGKSFCLKEARIYVFCPKDTTLASTPITGFVYIKSDYNTSYNVKYGRVNFLSKTNGFNFVGHIYTFDNAPAYMEFVDGVVSNTDSPSNRKFSIGNYAVNGVYKQIQGIRLILNDSISFPQGTQIVIEGVNK